MLENRRPLSTVYLYAVDAERGEGDVRGREVAAGVATGTTLKEATRRSQQQQVSVNGRGGIRAHRFFREAAWLRICPPIILCSILVQSIQEALCSRLRRHPLFCVLLVLMGTGSGKLRWWTLESPGYM